MIEKVPKYIYIYIYIYIARGCARVLSWTSLEMYECVAFYDLGGWKMRIGLAKVLLEAPDVLLLDEPTNHLDLESVEWLESFLSEQSIAMVIVSHDREFLDRVCTKIVDTEGGVCASYDDCQIHQRWVFYNSPDRETLSYSF